MTRQSPLTLGGGGRPTIASSSLSAIAVNAMLGEVAGKAVADDHVSETAKVQRKIVHDCLTGEGRERTDGWVPRYMAFPPRHYDPNKTLQIATDWGTVKLLFTGN